MASNQSAAVSPGFGAWGIWEEPARTDTRLLVFVQLVASGAGAQGPPAAVAAAVGAAAIVGLTAVHNLHLNP